MTHHEQAKMSHVEIASKDPAATRKFLEQVFGWKFETMPTMDYSMYGPAQGAEDASVGVRALMGPETPGSIGYVTVANIDDTLKAARAAGATVIMEKDPIPGGTGFLAVYLAPGGVVQGLFQTK